MSEAAIVQLVTSALVQIGIIAAAGLAAWPKVREISHNAKAAKVQTSNSHETNLRDDVTEVLDGVKQIRATQEEHGARIQKLEKRRRWLR